MVIYLSYRSILNAFSDCPHAWVLKGNVLYWLMQVREALGSYNNAIKLDDKLSNAWFGKGLSLRVLGLDFANEAIVCFDKAIELDPEFFEAYFSKGSLLEEMEKLNEALDIFEKGLKINPKDACAWCHKGVILNHLIRNEDAYESFKKASELGIPKDCTTFYENINIVLSTLRGTKELAEEFNKIPKEKVLQLPPETLNGYSWALYKEGRSKDGAEVAKIALEKAPEDVLILDTLACNLHALGSDKEAIEIFQKALSLMKFERSITWDALAEVYERLGMTEEAKQARQKFASVNEKK